jgi:GNAT superfamily N-acetyltransferase
MEIKKSEIDFERFGVVTAKASFESSEEISGALEWCNENQVEMLIVRCPTSDVNLVQNLERDRFLLTDTLVYYRKKAVETAPLVLPTGYTWRFAQKEDAEKVEALAAQTFKGYTGHYHADSRLSPEDADLVYSSWAANSCRDKNVADAVILIERDKEIAAFATLKRVENYMFEGVLFGVSPAHQGKSLYGALMQLAQRWGSESGMSQMLVSTQITNLAVQKVWCRQGFEPFKSSYTFHRWFS